MPITNTDAVLWYNVGEFGKAGYAVPNWSNDIGSLNPQILDWTYLVGRNLFHIMHHEDVDLRIPPSINTTKRIHKLYIRAANILAGRAVPPGENNMEVIHARPAGEVFRVFPVPFFLVRNQFMRRWAELILMSLAEAMQHTENRKSLEISTAFAGQVGQYIKRVYINMAIELFGKTWAVATADGFALTDADFAAYNPGDFFTQTEMVDTVPRLDREKIPGISHVADSIEEVGPGMPYPHLGFGEDYIETPSTTKRGFIVPVTKEAIFFDRTHLILSRAAEVGEVLGLNKEKRLIDLVIGATNNYKWKGTTYNTYQTSTPWINSLATNELVDWTNVDKAEQLFADILDPNTGELVLVRGTTVLVMPAYRHAAHRVFSAAELTFTASGSTTATVAANPLTGYRVYDSRLAYRRIIASGIAAATAKKYWFVGDFRRAFAYMENWPITVTQAPIGSEAEFNNDVVLRFKASERGAAAVLNPRYVVKNTG